MSALNYSQYIAYLDESGVHDLQSIDPNYPVFVLSCCIFDKAKYQEKILPLVAKFKMQWFGHTETILHSYDIRKRQKDFSFLKDAEIEKEFLTALSRLIDALPFTLISIVIRKDKHKEKYANPAHPYEFSIEMALERFGYFYENQSGSPLQTAHVILEKRGLKDDSELELSFRRSASDILSKQNIHFIPLFVDKKSNSTGLQIADLCGHPVGQHSLGKENRAYDAIKSKFYCSKAGKVQGYGLKMFP